MKNKPETAQQSMAASSPEKTLSPYWVKLLAQQERVHKPLTVDPKLRKRQKRVA
jgi:hypothetical protein